ncbi:TniB family NTP-binding protein [Dyella sp. 20L07]|uniref:TniB family NTP-binding protein n=1 Tax=Dyella sp. 20L07 TaxID=3384240 RepID=UPI003D2796AC
MPSTHIHPKIRDCLDATTKQRVDYIRCDRFIPYARGDAVLAEIDTIMDSSVGVRADCSLIVGNPGMGKTSILDFAERRHMKSTQERSRRGGLVRINLPQIVTDRRLFYSRILKHLGIPHSIADKPDFLHEQTVDAMRDEEVKALAIDEFHNFLGPKVAHLPEHMTAIRDIANIPIPIIGAGTKAAEACVLADDQLEQRFTRHWLLPWEETEELRNFLATLESRLPLKLPSNLAGPDLLPLLVRFSNGHMRRMIKLIGKAAEWAVIRGIEKITADLLRQALQELSRTSTHYSQTSPPGESEGGKSVAEGSAHG